MKKACFCVIIGNYDTLKLPFIVNSEWDYYCITDQDITSKFWKIIKIDSALDSKYQSRYIWTHFDKFIDCDIIVKHDANMIIINDLDYLLDFLTPEIDIVLAKHEKRNCIYDESIAVVNKFPNSKELVNNQMIKYRELGFPENYGLHYQGIRVMRNNEKIRKFNELWWEEISTNCWRDQLSFDFVRWISVNSEFELNIANINFRYLIKKIFKYNEHINHDII
jgi:hypothetical protein